MSYNALMPTNPETIAKLNALLAAIRKFPDPRRASAEWKQVYALLGKTDVPKNTVDNVVAGRYLDRLTQLVADLESPPTADDEPGPDPEVCQAAMRAFKRRIKLTRLDQESSINNKNPLTGGQSSGIDSIRPPDGFDADVWKALVKQGLLRDTGKGFYALVGE
jgi:hypothetical protein